MFHAPQKRLGDFAAEHRLAALVVRRLRPRVVAPVPAAPTRRLFFVVRGVRGVLGGVRGGRARRVRKRRRKTPLVFLFAPVETPQTSGAVDAHVFRGPHRLARLVHARQAPLRLLQRGALAVRQDERRVTGAVRRRVERVVVRVQTGRAAAAEGVRAAAGHRAAPARAHPAPVAGQASHLQPVLVRVVLVDVVRGLRRQRQTRVVRHDVPRAHHHAVRQHGAFPDDGARVHDDVLAEKCGVHDGAFVNHDVFLHVGPVHDAVLFDHHAAPERGRANHGVGADDAPLADHGARPNRRRRVDVDVFLAVRVPESVRVRASLAAGQRVRVGGHRERPPPHDVSRHGVVRPQRIHADGVFARFQKVRVDVVSELAFVERADDEIAPDVLVVKVVREQVQHLGRADVHVAVEHVRAHAHVGVVGKQRGVQGDGRELWFFRGGICQAEIARRGVRLVMKHAVNLRVRDHHQVGIPDSVLAELSRYRFEAHGHDGELLFFTAVDVRLERSPQIHVGHHVAVHEHEIGAHDVAVVDQTQRLTRADAVGGDDRVHDESIRAAPGALFQVRGDLLGVRAAEHEHLLDAVGREELQHVLDHRHVRQREQSLGALQGDRAEPLRRTWTERGNTRIRGKSAVSPDVVDARRRGGGTRANRDRASIERWARARR